MNIVTSLLNYFYVRNEHIYNNDLNISETTLNECSNQSISVRIDSYFQPFKLVLFLKHQKI